MFTPPDTGKAYRMSGIARVVRFVANIVVLILVVWILMALLHANQGNDLVHWFRDAADWLATWSRGIFRVHNRDWQIILDFGLAAVVYGVIGNVIGSRGGD